MSICMVILCLITFIFTFFDILDILLRLGFLTNVWYFLSVSVLIFGRKIQKNEISNDKPEHSIETDETQKKIKSISEYKENCKTEHVSETNESIKKNQPIPKYQEYFKTEPNGATNKINSHLEKKDLEKTQKEISVQVQETSSSHNDLKFLALDSSNKENDTNGDSITIDNSLPEGLDQNFFQTKESNLSAHENMVQNNSRFNHNESVTDNIDPHDNISEEHLTQHSDTKNLTTESPEIDSKKHLSYKRSSQDLSTLSHRLSEEVSETNIIDDQNIQSSSMTKNIAENRQISQLEQTENTFPNCNESSDTILNNINFEPQEEISLEKVSNNNIDLNQNEHLNEQKTKHDLTIFEKLIVILSMITTSTSALFTLYLTIIDE